MIQMKLLCVLVLSFQLIVCNGFSVKDTISKISSELGISKSGVKSKDSNDSNVDVCSEKCTKEIAQLRTNITELYMAFLALHAEFTHISQHVIFHEKALKHIAIWGHKQYGHQHNHSIADNNEHTNEDSHKCVKCNKNSSDDDEDEDIRVHKHHRHGHKHHRHDSDSDEQNDDRKTQNSNSEESSEEQDSSVTKNKVLLPVITPTTESHTSHQNKGNGSYVQMKFQSMENEFKNWFDKMLADIHIKSPHKNPIHLTDNRTDNDSQVHSHHTHVHEGSPNTDSEKRIEEKIQEMEKELTAEEMIFATCEVRPNRHIALLNQQDVRGRINLWQQKSNRGPLHMHIKLKGFEVSNHDHRPKSREVRETNLMPVESEPDSSQTLSSIQRHTSSHSHGFHVHEYGNLTRDCQSVGAHYNPLNLLHGGPNDVIRHVGDLGNVRCDENGETDIELAFSHTSLSGEHSIINRSLVIHSNVDDLGRNPKDPNSAATGSSGVRIACCVIEEVKTLPKDIDSQSEVAAVAAPAPSNKRRRDVSTRNQFQNLELSQLNKKFAKFENERKYESIFERRTSRKEPKFTRD